MEDGGFPFGGFEALFGIVNAVLCGSHAFVEFINICNSFSDEGFLIFDVLGERCGIVVYVVLLLVQLCSNSFEIAVMDKSSLGKAFRYGLDVGLRGLAVGGSG